jgi:hypothetical protein
VHWKSGVNRKPVVQPVLPRRGAASYRLLCITLNKRRICRSTKDGSRCCGNASVKALRLGRAVSSTNWNSAVRFVTGRRALILSGFPTVTAASFFACPVSVLAFPAARACARRARRMHLPRDDIPQHCQFCQSPPPPGPDVISKSIGSLHSKGATWRVLGEHWFGGTGKWIGAAVQFGRMLDRLVMKSGSKHVAGPELNFGITLPPPN